MRTTITCFYLLLGCVHAASAADLQQQVESLSDQVAQLTKENASGIKLGGAVRFQYSVEDYNEQNKDRGGDFDFDIFRLNLDGSIGDVDLSAEYRWFEYMHVIHHAYVGYQFTPTQYGKVGITKVPFGIQPYASHNFFFSSNYYLGLEDDYDMGLNYTYEGEQNRLDLAFYKNDEQGGLDGYVSDRTHRYSYDIVGVRAASEGAYDSPALAAAELNTFNARYAHQLLIGGVEVELGLSGLSGQIETADTRGDRYAVALHSVINYQQWNLQLQAAQYDNDFKQAERMAVGAYAFYDSIAAKADTLVANLAYSWPVACGPISNITFYNDYSLVTNKSADLPDTFMNVTGAAVSAGGLYTYIDFVTAKNQPFIGGTMVGDGDTTHRFNINFGYYF